MGARIPLGKTGTQFMVPGLRSRCMVARVSWAKARFRMARVPSSQGQMQSGVGFTGFRIG